MLSLAAHADERSPAGAGAAGRRLAAGDPELSLSERGRTRVSGLPGLGRATWGRLTWLGTLESPLSKPGHHELGLICLWLTALSGAAHAGGARCLSASGLQGPSGRATSARWPSRTGGRRNTNLSCGLCSVEAAVGEERVQHCQRTLRFVERYLRERTEWSTCDTRVRPLGHTAAWLRLAGAPCAQHCPREGT